MRKFSALVFAIFCLNLTACKEQVASIGEKAPALAAYDLEGKETSLDAWQGKTVLLSFWSETCGVCVKELKDLERQAAERNSKIQLIAINIDGDQRDTKATVAKHKITQNVLKDQLNMTAERYQVIGTPTSFVIDEKGIVQQKFEGLIPEEALNTLLN